MKNNKFNGTITKLPRDINPNEMIMEAMDKKYSICPFCGEDRRVDGTTIKDAGISKHANVTWYGKRKATPFSFLRFWEKNYHWRIDSWKCNRCGAEWKSEPYPTDAVSTAKSMTYTTINRVGELGIANGKVQ